jgi:hypothetical protein
VGACYFESLFSAPEGCPIQEILQVVTNFHPLFSEEMNQLLLKEVSSDEVRTTLFSMQSGKSPGPDGFPVEFFKFFYDLLKRRPTPHDQRVSIFQKNFGPLNSTFLCPHPKEAERRITRGLSPNLLLQCDL